MNVDFGDDASIARDAGSDGAAGEGGTMVDAGPEPEEDAGGEPDAGARPAPDDWPALYASALCGALEACYGGAGPLADALDGRDCTTLNENALKNGELRHLGEAVDEGRVLWRPDELPDCLADLDALACDARSARLPASCELLIVGTVALGDACALDEECAGDAFCDRSAGECPGTCTAQKAEGEACADNDDDQCRDGLICFRESETCERLGALGDECGDGLPACSPGLECREQGGSSECVALDAIYFRELGEDCTPGGDLCAPPLVCESASSAAGVCAERVGDGASCKRASPSQCPTAQYCSAMDPGETGTCIDYPGDGEPCIDDGRVRTCADGAVCIDGTCHARRQVGETCTEAVECWSGACGDDGRCEAAPLCAVP